METDVRKGLHYDFPMDKFVCSLVLPRDLTQHEVDRLCAALHLLVIPGVRLAAGGDDG